ncbi:MAG: ParB/RepB/Spo0J family partition protein [Desulfobacteraceae bacterium]|nr:ParB/RepB/Spo0J family partition protein [Desulfobacteraceae bacterium]
MTKRSALGKGLNALLPGDDEQEEARGRDYFLCPVGAIKPNTYQPREEMDDTALAELAASIREKGILQPLVVTETRPGAYELIAGERRLRASKLAGLTEVPVILKEASPQDRLELALIENIQRQNLNPLEEARAYERLTGEFGLTQEEVAAQVGKERSTVANLLRILNLPEYAKEDLARGTITLGHARVLLGIENQEAARGLRDEIVAKGLTVRQAEQLAKAIKKPGRSGPRKKAAPALPDSYCRTVSTELAGYLGTKSRIVQNGSRGKLEIEYNSPEELKRLLGIIVIR